MDRTYQVVRASRHTHVVHAAVVPDRLARGVLANATDVDAARDCVIGDCLVHCVLIGPPSSDGLRWGWSCSGLLNNCHQFIEEARFIGS